MKTFKRIVSRETVADQLRGSTPLARGVWVDRAGAMHFSVPDLLAFFGVPDTPENRAVMEEQIHEVARAAGVAELVEQEERSN